MDALSSDLTSIANQASSSRAPAYLKVLKSLLARPASELPADQLQRCLSAYLDQAVFSDTNSTGGNLVVGRQVLSDFDLAVVEAGASSQGEGGEDATMGQNDPAIKDEEVRRTVFEDALEKVQPRVISFEEQASSLRQHLSVLLEESEDWLKAARVLQAIPLDSGHRSVSDLYKLRTFVRIVRLLLEGDDAVGADTFLKRASLIVHNVPGAISSSSASAMAASSSSQASVSEKDRQEARSLGLQYKLCQARIYDSQRRFAEAAIRYHELSYVGEIDEGDRNHMLSAAVTASILAPAGPQRSRILASLVRDERTASLPQHTILTRVLLDQIVRPAEIASFEQLLAPHQRATLPKTTNDGIVAAAGPSDSDGMDVEGGDEEYQESKRHGPSTVLDRAMMEHNILATSRLYTNITLQGLGSLLDLSAPGAETMARRMIAQGRLRAEIDQVDGLILFKSHATGRDAGPQTVTAGGKQAQSGSGGAAGVGGGEGESAGGTTGNDQGMPDSQGTGGGGDDDDDPNAVYTKRWDASIAKTASGVEDICARLRAKHLIPA